MSPRYEALAAVLTSGMFAAFLAGATVIFWLDHRLARLDVAVCIDLHQAGQLLGLN